MNEPEDYDLDAEPTPIEKQIEADNIALAEEMWKADEESIAHAEMDKKLDSWTWMKEKKYATMFKEIEHRLEGALGKGLSLIHI